MSPLVWTLAPLVATFLAILWVSWRARPRRPADAIDTIEQHRRFREALGRLAQQPVESDHE